MEKNMIASKGRRIIAVGNEAYDMFEKAPANIVVNSPMAFGMIANLELQEIALYSMMKKIDHFLGIGSDMFFSVPLDMTAVEKRAYYHVANGHWLRQNRVYMVEAPIADAIAMGVDLNRNAGSMIVNIGAQMAFGMIANLELQEIALYSMMKKIDHFLGIGSDMFFSVPLDMTAVEKRAYYHVANGHWLRQNRVYMVEAPIADAIAMGVDLNRNAGSMIVNIGAQSTQFSIITDGKIIIAKKIPIGGRQMNEAICSEIRKRYNLQIGTRTGKRLKIAMGRLNDQRREARKVVGIDGISGLPREEIISGYVVNAGIMNCVNEIAAEMKTFLERIPPQISYHISREGIYLAGGSTKIPYIDNYLASYTGVSFNLSPLYEKATVAGLEKIIRDHELMKWAQPVKQRKL